MDKKTVFEIVKKLQFDTKKIIYKKGNTSVYIIRPSKLSKRFNEYDVHKNFQIFLRIGEREFRPNHLRVMIDLNLRIRSRPELKKKLLLAFDNIFYGADPEKELKALSRQKFEHFLNDLIVIGTLAQLFVIEQEYCYHRKSNFDPPTLFFQGWVREFLDNPKEIDNLCMSVCKGLPPLQKYVSRENKKSKNYSKKLKPLWYLKS
ncbi:MAG: hypothetical protein QXS93_00635 [Candidatus Micrarchaeia archaeon]